MNKNRLWLIGIGAAIVLVLVGGWFVGVSPILSQTSAASAQLASTDAVNSASSSRLSTLKANFSRIDDLKSQLKELSASVPDAADSAVFLREIDALTSAHSVQLQSVTLQNGTTFVPPVAPAAASSTTSTDSSATPSPTPSPSASASASPVVPAVAGPAARLVLIPTQISVSGTYDNVMAFVGGVQAGERLYLVSNVTVTSDSTSGGFTAALTGWIYALPSATDTAQAATGSTSNTTAAGK